MAADKVAVRTRGMGAAHVPPVQTEEELELVKRYMLLGIVMRILDHDIRVIGVSGMKLPQFYESMLRAVQDRVLLDLAAMRRQFRKKGINVYEESRVQDGLYGMYVCRGYHHRVFMLWASVKAESEHLLKGYTSRGPFSKERTE